MSNELSELIALACPDLAAKGGIQILSDPVRRLSVKQMTATELAEARAAAAAEIETALQKATEIAKAAKAASIKLAQEESTNAVETTSRNNKHNSTTPPTSTSKEASPMHVEVELPLPRSSAPRKRIISLPNLLDDLSISSLNAQLPLDKQRSAENLYNVPDEKTTTAAVLGLCDQRSKSKNSFDEENDTNSQQISDSIELLRMQRCDRDRAGDRESRRDRSLSPSSKSSGTGDISALRQQRERSPAPDRLHSSSISISSIGSAASASASASASVSVSLNVSRRGSNTSNIGELAGVAESLATASPLTPSSAAAATETTKKFPLTKTESVPNLEKRRSSLAGIFPGPSPLVAPEVILHTQPKVSENAEQQQIREEHDFLDHEIPTGKAVHRTKTPPPVGVSLGVTLKKVSPPRTHICVKKNEGPMLGVVLRKVEKKVVQQKSILDDDTPLYHLSIVRSGGESKEHKPLPKPKPKPTALQKSATSTAVPAKTNPGGILTGPQVIRTINNPTQQQLQKLTRPQPGVPITIQKIEGDKIIIIKKFIVPKNGKIPEQYLKVGDFVNFRCLVTLVYVEANFGFG